MGPINYESYKYYSEEIIEKLLETRLKNEDCNAGVIFDNLQSELCPLNSLVPLKMILKVID